MNDCGMLYLCATPIGNLGDITLRTLDTLNAVDLIACEDTRQSLKLLRHYDIAKPLISYHEHNEKQMSQQLIAKLRAGESIALITDAGMPGISDPGYELVRLAIAEEIPFTVLPGPSAALTALVASGLAVNRFIFEGFLPRKGKERTAILESWATEERSLIFYEAPHRLLKTLEELARLWPERPMAACRELTKKFEEIRRGSCQEVLAHFQTHPVKGEFVLILGPNPPATSALDPLSAALDYARELLANGARTKEAAQKAAEKFQVSKRDVYQGLLD